MDLFNPADRRPVHFMGIGGAGMSALALIARRRGVVVSGCDLDVSGTADLAALGATILEGHDPGHLDGLHGSVPRALVVTAAVPEEHPEVARARQLGVPVIPRKEALAALVAAPVRTGAVLSTFSPARLALERLPAASAAVALTL